MKRSALFAGISILFMQRPHTATEEAYTSYKTTEPFKGYKILQHANGLVVLMTNNEHALHEVSSRPIKVDFLVETAGDTSSQKQLRKHAAHCRPRTVVAKVFFENGQEIPIFACVQGSVVELNSNLLQNPSALFTEPEGNGYICIMRVKGKLLSEYLLA